MAGQSPACVGEARRKGSKRPAIELAEDSDPRDQRVSPWTRLARTPSARRASCCGDTAQISHRVSGKLSVEAEIGRAQTDGFSKQKPGPINAGRSSSVRHQGLHKFLRTSLPTREQDIARIGEARRVVTQVKAIVDGRRERRELQSSVWRRSVVTLARPIE
jgi:hypothetical protein